MTGWKREIVRLAAVLEEQLETAIGRTRRRVLGHRPPRAFLYRTFGTAQQVHLFGRVLEDPPVPPADAGASRWRNLIATLGRFDSDEVPGARLLLRFGSATAEVTADPEGYFGASLPGSGIPDPADPLWQQASADLLSPAGISGNGKVLVPAPSARFGVISDLDDTVIRSGVRRVLRLLAATLLENARTRLPFPGVAAFYHALHAGAGGRDGNPVFYVSSSPWNLHDFLLEFLEVRGIPVGPILLRDWGTSRESLLPPGHHQHKSEAIDRVFETYPELPFILIGDSGQQDPEIYTAMASRHPGRVMAIYIRDVTLNPIRSAAVEQLALTTRTLGSAMVLVPDTVTAAKHAADHGWIAPERVETVAREKESSEDATGP